MSLTSFLKNRDVIERFKQEFECPKLNVNYKLFAPPLTKRHGMAGTGFDYLLRFYINRLNPKAIILPWVAETGAAVLMREELHAIMNQLGSAMKDVNFHMDSPYLTTDDLSMLMEYLKVTAERESEGYGSIADKIINEAKENYATFLKNGRLNDKLIKSALLLAQLDPVYRAGYIDPNLGVIDKKDITDLKRIISIVDARSFKAKKICLLNPTFGKASELVGGADADLVIDDVLIDIKTTKRLQLSRRDFNQLVGYYSLYKIGGIKGSPSKHKIKKLGIYFSRFGYLHVLNIEDVINQKTFPKFLTWFKRRAKDEKEVGRKSRQVLKYKKLPFQGRLTTR